MNGTLPGVEGSRVDRALSQFFTPAWLAARVALWANLNRADNLLEPSAGRGALITAALSETYCCVDAWDIDSENCAVLRKLLGHDPLSHHVVLGDFRDHKYGAGEFDLALMNPPYERNQDIAFIERALDCSDRVVGIFQSRIVHSQGRAEFWRHHDITREVILSERPHFGGEHSAKTDFVVLEIERRASRRKQGEASPVQREWW